MSNNRNELIMSARELLDRLDKAAEDCPAEQKYVVTSIKDLACVVFDVGLAVIDKLDNINNS